MKKGIILGFLIVFLLLITTKTVFALVGFLPQFGGRIISTKALEIQELEMAGFQCFIPGSTISIAPIGSPTGTPISYFIPAGVYSKTGYSPRAGQLIIGKYGGQMSIPCMLSYYPFTIVPIFLNTIPLFGNSR